MLRRNRGRSLLTMFGIIIGVASVVTVSAIGQGVANQVAQQTERLGSDLIIIRPGRASTDVSPLDGFGQSGAASIGALSMADLTAISKTSGVQTAIPLSIVAADAETNSAAHAFSLPVIGTTAALSSALDQSLAFGSFLTGESSDANKVILGSSAAENMFTQNAPLGETVRILGQEFIVAGILAPSTVSSLSLGVDFNNAIFMSNDEAQTLTNNHAHIYEILARPSNPARAAGVVDRLRGLLLAAHGGQQDFTVLTQAEAVTATHSIISLLTTFISGVAAIALLVGGVGIMNVMLVSVTERLHEIGIRKAVGATNRQILRQFVVEAAVLSVTGAAIGVLLAACIAVALQLTTDLTPVLTWQAVILACLASVVVGVVFGIAPALKASKRDPISALRNI
jgi:putative ABC transport system permease protein